MSYKPFCSSSVRGECEPILVGGLTYIGRWYVPILVTMRTYIGQLADQYRLLSKRCSGAFLPPHKGGGETEPSRLGGLVVVVRGIAPK